MNTRCMQWVSCLVVTLLLIGCGGRGAKSDKAFDYKAITLDNGLQVITLEDRSTPIVAVQLWYHVGSKDEQPDRTGFAHMFEHMMFRGNDRLGPTDHFNLIRGSGGTTNAYTNFDQTVYIETLPSNQLEMALWLEAERMGFLSIDQDGFDTERKVVEEERRMRSAGPYGKLLEKVFADVFTSHPYQWTPIGNIAHLRASSVPELRAFWHKYYVPNNATLVIVGDVSHREAQKLAKEYFGWIPRYDDPPRVTVTEPPLASPKKMLIQEKNAPAPIAGIGYRTVPLGHEDALALDMLGLILGGGNSSRIYRELVVEKQAAMMAMSAQMNLEQDGAFGAGAIMSPLAGGNMDTVMQLLEQQVAHVRSEPVTEAELTKAKNQMLSSLVTGRLTVEQKADALGTAAVLEGDVSNVNKQLDRIRAMTAEDLMRVANKYLVPERQYSLKVPANLLGALAATQGSGGDAEENAPITAEPETNPPPPGKPGLQRPKGFPAEAPVAAIKAYKPDAQVVRMQLDNGMKLIVVPNHEVPFVTMQLGLLTGGAWTEQKPGTASMALQMLTKGTAQHTEAELASELETYAISLGGSAGLDAATVSAACVKDQVQRAAQFLAEVVQHPTFPADEFNRLRQQAITGLALQMQSPEYLADREYNRRLFGDHPYARTATGEPKDLQALSPDVLKAWWSANARPEQAVLIVAGDITADEAMGLAMENFGAWQAAAEPAVPNLPTIAAPQSTQIYLVDKPGSAQSQIRIGHLGIDRKNPAYPASRVVTNYFGGGFNARINDTLRVKKGLTYGASGYFSASRFGGEFQASTFSKTESTAEAVQAAIDEIKRLKVEPPTAEELSETKSFTLGSLALQNETPQQVAGQQWLMAYNDLPLDFYERLIDGIASTNGEDCMQLIAEAVHPDRLLIVVVGDASKLKADLEKIAPVTVVQP